MKTIRSMFFLSCALGLSAAVQAQQTVFPSSHPLAREALYHFFLGRSLESDALLAAAARRRVDGAEDVSVDLLRGILSLSYGVADEAERLFRRVVQRGAPNATTDQAWFHLAKIAHRHGRAAQALAALEKVRERLPGDLDDERRTLQAQLLIDAGKPAAAVALLETLGPQSPFAAYARFNLGVALVRTGDTARGLALLNALGRSPVADAELVALRDKANVAFAYMTLQRGDPQAARDTLARVRLDGLVANKALLGMGWALSVSQDHQRALVYWDELARRDVMHSEVQEALLALPYTLLQLDARKQALARYQEADAMYAAEQARLDRAIEIARSGKLVDDLLHAGVGDDAGWLQRIRDLPAGPATRYLAALLATHEFQSSLDDLRHLAALRDRTARWSHRLDELESTLTTGQALFDPQRKDMLAARIQSERTRVARLSSESREVLDAQRHRIARLATAELENRRRRLDEYRAQARLAVAEIYDRALRDSTPQEGSAR